MRIAIVALAACGTARPNIPPPPVIPLDDVVVRLDQQAPGTEAWQAKPRWPYVRDYDVYEPAAATAATPNAILIHDAGGHRRELGPLARHLARHGVRAIVPAVDYADRSEYGMTDGLRMHWPASDAPFVLVGHGAGGYIAGKLSVSRTKSLLGTVVLAPARPPGLGSESILYAGDDAKRLVQLDVEHASGRCAADAGETVFRMTRNERTRAQLAGASYCSVLGDAQCDARCGSTQSSTSTPPAFEAIARVVTGWTASAGLAEADLLGATPTTRDIETKAAPIGSEDWAMPGFFVELGGATSDDSVGARGALGVRLDYHPVPTWSPARQPAFARRPSIFSPRRWGMGGYAEIAWQHDELDRDDLRLAAGFAFATQRGSSHLALGLGANLLLGQHGATVGADATLHINPMFALRAGVTRSDQLALHASLVFTLPAGAVAILVPLVM